MIDRSHGELGSSCTVWSDPVRRGCDQSQRTQCSDEMTSVEMRWDEMRWHELWTLLYVCCSPTCRHLTRSVELSVTSADWDWSCSNPSLRYLCRLCSIELLCILMQSLIMQMSSCISQLCKSHMHALLVFLFNRLIFVCSYSSRVDPSSPVQKTRTLQMQRDRATRFVSCNSKLTEGHWYSCYSIGRAWFPVSLPL